MTLKAALRNALLQCRAGKNISQEEMAHGADISVRYYRKLEAGNGNPSLKVLAKFHVRFGLDLNAIAEQSADSLDEEEA